MVTKTGVTTRSRSGRREKERDDDFDYRDDKDPDSDDKMPWFGWLGLAIMIVGEIALWVPGNPLQSLVATAFTPIMWTGYILVVDGWIWERGYYSYFKNAKREWPMLLLFSILIWVMFEVFNFPAHAWIYQNMPKGLFVKGVVFAWAYATIIPALLRTRSLFATFDMFDQTHPWRLKFTPFTRALLFIIGLGLTFIPPMFNACTPQNPWCTANLLIPLVWFGFIFMIEPINYRIGAPSVLRDLEPRDNRELVKTTMRELERRDMREIEKPKSRSLAKSGTHDRKAREKNNPDRDKGRISFFLQVLVAGLFCGLLWETWNIQAFAHSGLTWDYWLNPIYHICVGHSSFLSSIDPAICAGKIDLKIGKMPILGFLGYPPFIWECFAIWELIKWVMHSDKLLKPQSK